ncbi:Duo1p Ecym_3072 [Eremothecium cymbalariae DBVPG|uniref:DASH complex subunit DUO1 n=1 Tax=Eremothecium cymbalariae (strain CBS 270.75 / DBVPG 7215 / KCTC 17166 / NRRL Y-17582) TaxID=931890 RepID=G8JR15_ERECY|nr:Hypothetical protein Ecym_3072 [Eremothecium cymbalariae DBVPG\
MSDTNLDNATIDKLIPQIFDQMRSNQLNNTKTNGGSLPLFMSSVSTPTLLKEVEQLDSILPVIKHLNNSLRHSTSDNLNRIKKTCESVNKVLDTWIKIQSQAGYVSELLDDKEYLKYIDATQGDEAKKQNYMENKRAEVEEIRRKIQEKNKPAVATVEAPLPKKPFSKATANYKKGKVGASGIPRSSAKVRKPVSNPVVTTGAKNRRMFR